MYGHRSRCGTWAMRAVELAAVIAMMVGLIQQTPHAMPAAHPSVQSVHR